MNKQDIDIVQILREKTIKAKTQIATDFVNRAIEKAAEAAELGYNYAIITSENGQIVNQYSYTLLAKGLAKDIDLASKTSFEYDNKFYITSPLNMNHLHADEKLRELGFKTEFKDDYLSKISW